MKTNAVTEQVAQIAHSMTPKQASARKKLVAQHMAILGGAGLGNWAVSYYRIFMQDDQSEDEILREWKERYPKCWEQGKTFLGATHSIVKVKE